MDSDFEYAALSPTDYGLVLHNPENRVFMSPSYFFLGDIRGAMPGQISDWLAVWLEMENTPEKDFEPLFVFDPDKKYNVGRNEKGRFVRRKLHSMRPAALKDAAAFRASLSNHHRTRTFIDMGGDEIFVPPKNPIFESPHTGEVVLSGRARKKGDARTDATYHKIRVIGPFRDSDDTGLLFADVSCDCQWHYFITGKNSHFPVQILDSDIAGFLNFISKNPGKVKNKPADRAFFMPFRTDMVDEQALPYFTVEEMPFLSTSVRDLNPLKMSVLIKKFFDNASHYSIDRLLTKCPVFDSQTIQLILDRRADYRMLLKEFPFAKAKKSSFEEPIQNLYWSIFSQLGREQFALAGAVVENKDTSYESPCLHFEGPDGRIARVTVNGLPPVIIRRKKLRRKVISPVRDYTHKATKEFPKINPFAELYKRPVTPRMDDMLRAGTEYMVTLPEKIPVALWRDYARAIHNAIEGYNQNLDPDYEKPESIEQAIKRARAYRMKGSSKQLERIRAALS
ncbi:hypothetical protein GF343_02805 [Candidatus Woesearchaeota archaeon]|nr:hypothetical protein [Candidatus Woesearchaeota archaeon]